MNWLRLLRLTLAVAVALALPARGSAQDLADKAIAVWELVRDAEKDEAAKNGAAAYAKYKQAIQILQEMRAADPNWNPHLVEFRLKDCAEHIADLEKRGAHLQSPPPQPQPAPTPTAPPAAAIPDTKWREELARLTAELHAARAAQTELQQKLIAAEDALRRTQLPPSVEIARLRREKQLIETQLRATQQLAAELRLQADQREAALAALKTAQAQLASTRQSLHAAQQDAQRQQAELAKTTAALDAAQKDAAARLAKLAAERQDAEKKASAAAARARELEAKLRTAPSRAELDSLQTQLHKYKSAVADLSNQLQANQNAAAQLQIVREENARLQRSLSEARDSLQKRDAELKHAAAAIAAAQTENNARLAALSAEKSNLEQTLNAALTQLRQIETKNAPPDAVPKSEFDSLQSSLDALKSQLWQTQDALHQATAELQQKDAALARLTAALDASQTNYNAQLAELAAARQDLERQLRAARDDLAQLQAAQAAAPVPQLAAGAPLPEAQPAIPQTTATPPATAAHLEQLHREKRDLEARIAQIQSQMQLARSDHDAVVAQMQRIERQLSESNARLAAAQQEAAHYKSVAEHLTAELNTARNQSNPIAPAPAPTSRLPTDTKQLAALKAQNQTLSATVAKQHADILRLQRDLDTMRRKSPSRNAAAHPRQEPAANRQAVAHPQPANGQTPDTPRNDSPKSAATPLPDSARAAFDEADRLAAAARFEEAAAAYEKILVQHPNSVVVLANLGVVRMHQQQHDAALELLKRCIALAPDDAFSHSMLGLCHYFRKEYDDALAALSRAIALNPQDALSYNYRGTTCGQKGWYEAAENDLRKAIELQPTFGDAHRNLANIYMKQRPASPRLAHFHYLKSLEFGVKPDAELQRLIEEKIGVHTGHGAPAPTQP